MSRSERQVIYEQRLAAIDAEARALVQRLHVNAEAVAKRGGTEEHIRRLNAAFAQRYRRDRQARRRLAARAWLLRARTRTRSPRRPRARSDTSPPGASPASPSSRDDDPEPVGALEPGLDEVVA